MLKNMLSLVGFFFFVFKKVLSQWLREVANIPIHYQNLCTKPCLAYVCKDLRFDWDTGLGLAWRMDWGVSLGLGSARVWAGVYIGNQASLEFIRVLKLYVLFPSVPNCFYVFLSAPKCSQVIQSVPKSYKKISKKFPIVPKCSHELVNVPKCS